MSEVRYENATPDCILITSFVHEFLSVICVKTFIGT